MFDIYIYIYGNPVEKYRKEQWYDLIQSEYAGFLKHKPRLMIGDFNDIKNNAEKQGGVIRSAKSFTQFNRLLAILGMQDLRTIGEKYTWAGNRL